MRTKICILTMLSLALWTMASAQGLYQKSYIKVKNMVDGVTGATITTKKKSTTNPMRLRFTLDKEKEQLRKSAYKYRDDIPKEVLKQAKKDKAILHCTWIQGQTQAWDLQGRPLNIPDAYKPLRRYNDTLFVIQNTLKDPNQPYCIEMYVLGKGGIGCVAKSLDDYSYYPFLNSVLVNDKTEQGYYWNNLYSLDGKHSFIVQKDKSMNITEMVDSCRRDTAKSSVEYTSIMDSWKYLFFNTKICDDEELYKNNVWVQKANSFYAMGEYRKALDCIDQFVSFDMHGMNYRSGMFAHQLKYMQIKSLMQLKKYNAVLNAMDIIKGCGSLAHDMYYSPQLNDIIVSAGVPKDVEATFKNKFLVLCQECQRLQAQQERSNAILGAALLGAISGTVSNIAGGGSSNQSSSGGYVGGAATSASSAGSSQQTASTKTAPLCSACNGTGRCQACKNHPGRATSNEKDKTQCKNCNGQIKCQYCGGSGYKKL